MCIRDRQTDVYEDALEDKNTPMPRSLPENRRSVIRLRRYLEPQRAALNKLSMTDIPMIPENSTLRLHELANRAANAVEELDELQGRLISVQEEHDANIAQFADVASDPRSDHTGGRFWPWPKL